MIIDAHAHCDEFFRSTMHICIPVHVRQLLKPLYAERYISGVIMLTW